MRGKVLSVNILRYLPSVLVAVVAVGGSIALLNALSPTPTHSTPGVIEFESSTPVARTADLVIAASNSSTRVKFQADYVCDGADDGLQLAQAINALPTDGGTISMLEGTYTLAPVWIEFTKPNVTVSGQGWNTVLKLRNQVTANILGSPAAGSRTITVDDASNFIVNQQIAFVSDDHPTGWAVSGGTKITEINGNTLTIRRGLKYNAPVAQNPKLMDSGMIFGNLGNDFVLESVAVDLNGPNYTRLSTPCCAYQQLMHTWDSSYAPSSPNGVTIRDCYIHDTHRAIGNTWNTSRLWVENCYIENAGHGFLSEGGSTYSSIRFIGNHCVNSDLCHYQYGSKRDFLVIGNTISRADGRAIWVYSNQTIIADNVIRDAGEGAICAKGDGVTISSNRISYSSNISDHMVYLVGGSDNVEVVGNQISGSASAHWCLYLGSSTGKASVRGNTISCTAYGGIISRFVTFDMTANTILNTAGSAGARGVQIDCTTLCFARIQQNEIRGGNSNGPYVSGIYLLDANAGSVSIIEGNYLHDDQYAIEVHADFDGMAYVRDNNIDFQTAAFGGDTGRIASLGNIGVVPSGETLAGDGA
jgi:hypothetical protein